MYLKFIKFPFLKVIGKIKRKLLAEKLQFIYRVVSFVSKNSSKKTISSYSKVLNTRCRQVNSTMMMIMTLLCNSVQVADQDVVGCCCAL